MRVARSDRPTLEVIDAVDPIEFVRQLRAFHGFAITCVRQGAWYWLEIPDLRIKYHAQRRGMLQFLAGYQQGWIAGRKYTGGEQTALRDLIKELERAS